MNTKQLLKIIYRFYPQNISFEDESEKYVKTSEYSNLKNAINSHRNGKVSYELKMLKKEIEKHFETTLEDCTVFEWNDRCYNWQIVLPKKWEGKKKYVLCLNLSILIDVYIIYVLEVEYDKILGKLKYLPRRNEDIELEVFQEEVKYLKAIVEKHTNRKEIQMSIGNMVIPNISFEEIPLGKLTYFNAFFLNRYETRIA
ncbi:hypothetical protein [Ulvibacterium marinum]|uniref:hypothetical protein n=1 Tax=Ulvibacterium marinum TaxID=2419782 RepID=UPI0024945DA5|nr:hypothetical protein [Ulvibacterium marinum]